MSGDLTAFFYGTLMASEIFFYVCYGKKFPPEAVQKQHTFTPAVLDGFCRRRVRHADYPGIVRQPGQSVRGTYVTGLTTANMKKLEEFEGSEYALETVSVRLVAAETETETEQMRESSTYVFLAPDKLEHKEWDYQEFRRNKLVFWAGSCHYQDL